MLARPTAPWSWMGWSPAMSRPSAYWLT